MASKKIIGVLTGGGDCPGLNAVIRAVTKRSLYHGYEVVGINNGWQGLLDKNTQPLTHASVSGVVHLGGTLLGTSRTNVLKDKKTIEKAFKSFKDLGLHALVAIGGEGTLTVTHKLFEMGMPVVAVPKTIDNDIGATDYTVGFGTAVQVATDAIDRLRTTAESHRRVIVVEVMGRHAGWIATHSGLAAGADVILIPEHPMELDEIIKILNKRHQRGKDFSIIVVAEGAQLKLGKKLQSFEKERKDAFGRPLLGGIGQALSNLIEDKTGIETRVTVLGYTQRGGTPTALDRVIGTRMGSLAADMIKDKDFGHMTALRGGGIESVPLKEAVKKLKTVDDELWDLAKSLMG